jgi:hypothetical protein
LSDVSVTGPGEKILSYVSSRLAIFYRAKKVCRRNLFTQSLACLLQIPFDQRPAQSIGAGVYNEKREQAARAEHDGQGLENLKL